MIRADLSRLRIRRDRGPEPEAPLGTAGWLVIILLITTVTAYGLDRAGLIPADIGKIAKTVIPAQDVQFTTVIREATPGAEILLTASGYVVSDRVARLRFKLIGRLVELRCKEGNRVQAGQVLAKLDDRDLRAQHDRAVAILEARRAALGELEAGSRTQEIDRARAQESEARAELAHAQAELKRFEDLHRRGVVSRQQVDEVRMRHDMAVARCSSTRNTVSLLVAGPRAETIRSAAAQVREAEASVAYARTQLEEAVLTAPFDGVVLRKHAEVGETVGITADLRQSGEDAVVTVADLGALLAEVEVSETNLGKVSAGLPCDIVLDAYPEVKYRGQVQQIMPQANRQKAVVPVKVTFLTTDDRLRPDMSVKVDFHSREVPTGGPRLWVDAAAVTDRGGKPVVFLMEGEKASTRGVELGETRNGRRAVVRGLSEGDRLVLSPPADLSDGDPVRVSQEVKP